MADKAYYKQVESAVHLAITKIYRKYFSKEEQSATWKKKVIFMTEKYIGVKNINTQMDVSINSDLPDEQLQSLSAFLMRISYDLETLRDLCLMPPKGCPFENWVCCAGPCKSGKLLKNHNIKTVLEFRKRLGFKDDLPEDYYDKFKEEWGEILDGKRGENGIDTTPFLLLPVRDLHQSVRDKIVAREPGLANFVDNLFLCCDHFKRKNIKSGFDRRVFATFSVQNLNKTFESNKLKFVLSGEGHFIDRAHLTKLISLLNRDVQMSVDLTRRNFNRKSHIARLSQSYLEMENNYYPNGFDNNGHYGTSYYDLRQLQDFNQPQSSQRYQE